MKIVQARISDLMYPTFFFFVGIIFPKNEMRTQKFENEVLFQSERKKKK
jgi:hypothetical protein